MTTDKLIAEMDKALQFPGVSNAWTMPIKARIDMLSTGIRTPVGIKVFGKDLGEMERLAEIEAVVKRVPGTTSAFAGALTGGYYLNIEPDRAALARYGLSVGDCRNHRSGALGGEMVTTTVEGRERFGVTVRYLRELRSDPSRSPREVLGAGDGRRHGAAGPGGRVVHRPGTPGIRTENAPSAYIFVDIRAGTSAATWPTPAQRPVAAGALPPATTSPGAASSRNMERARAKMKIVVPSPCC